MEDPAMSPATSKKTKLEGDVYQPSPESIARALIPNWEAQASRAQGLPEGDISTLEE
jgi:hypothetical protein